MASVDYRRGGSSRRAPDADTPAALEFEFVDLAFAVVLAVMLFVVPGLGAGRLAPAGSVTPVLAGRLVVCLAADLSSSCRHRPGPPSSLA
jgi:hypothetical protein